jgi:hypothetical protein
MTISGITTYELSRNQIIEAALRKVGALAIGQTPTSEAYTNAQIALNAQIAAFQTFGMSVWKRTTYAITPVLDGRDNEIGQGKTTDIDFPLRIEHAYMLNTSSGTRSDMTPLGRQRFDQLTSESTGKPVHYHYLPKINFGVLSVWPAPDADTVSNYTINIHYRAPFSGFTSADETADFPQEWQNPLIYGLAVSLAPEYGLPLNDRKLLMDEFNMWLGLASGVTEQDESVFFQVDTWGGNR